jgi:hypothetical protein
MINATPHGTAVLRQKNSRDACRAVRPLSPSADTLRMQGNDQQQQKQKPKPKQQQQL